MFEFCSMAILWSEKRQMKMEFQETSCFKDNREKGQEDELVKEMNCGNQYQDTHR